MGELQTCKYLSEAKLLHILKTHESTEDVVLTSTSKKAGTEVGDNYSGELVRVDLKAKVRGEEREYHWMAKLPPQGDLQNLGAPLALPSSGSVSICRVQKML